MPIISENIIERVRTAADVVDVISSYIELKKRGRNFFGLCPFHNEKTPSFSVNPEKQIYKCFGCGAGGGSINFVMEIDSLNFVDTIMKLGQMYNIKIEIDKKDFKTKNIKSELLEMNYIAAEYYQNQLQDLNNKNILKYLQERSFDEEMINLFKLGFSNDKPKQLLELLQKKKFSSDAMKKSGLFYESKNGYFDRFRSRLIFPISDKNGDIIAFAGRTLDKNNPAKYMNSPETIIYNKSKVLYGLNNSLDSIRKEKSVILVEGYFDLIRLYQHNIKNVAAISGTAFTDMHATIIKQYSSNIFIAFDGDNAGKNAAIRTGYTLLRNSINSKIINTPSDMDPDDWVQLKGKNVFEKSIKEAHSVINFHYNNFISKDQPITIFIDEVLGEISLIKEPIFRELTAKYLSEVINVSEENILITLNEKVTKKNRLKFTREKIKDTPIQSTNELNTLLEDDFIRLCLNKDILIRKLIFENMNKEWLRSKIHKEIYTNIYIHLKSKDGVPINLLINKITDNEIRKKITDLTINFEKFNPSIDMAIECLIRLEENLLKLELVELRNKLKGLDDKESMLIIKKINLVETNIKILRNKYK